MDHKNTKIDNSPNTDSFFFDLQRKEGLYRNISELKKEFNNKLNNFLENQKQNEELISQRFTSIINKQNDLFTLFVDIKEKQDLIDSLPTFKRKIEEDTMTHAIKIEQLTKDLSNLMFKYDKIYLDNFHYPNLIGNDGCRFLNFKQYVTFTIKKIDELLKAKTNQDELIQSMAAKNEQNVANFLKLNANLEKKLKQYANIKIDELRKIVTNMPDVFMEKCDGLKIENSKYAAELLIEAKKLSETFEKIRNIEIELTEKIADFEDKNNKLNLERNKEVDNLIVQCSCMKNEVTHLEENVNNFRENEEYIIERIKKINNSNTDINSKMEVATNQIAQIQTDMKNVQNNLNINNAGNANFFINKLNSLTNNTNETTKTTNNINNLTNNTNNQPASKSELDRLAQIKKEIEKKVYFFDSKISDYNIKNKKAFESLKNEFDAKAKEISEQAKISEKKMNQLQGTLDDALNRIKTFTDTIYDIKKFSNGLDKRIKPLETKINQRDTAMKDIEEIKSQNKSMQITINDNIGQFHQLNNKLNELSTNIEMLSKSFRSTNDSLTTTNIKKKILNKMREKNKQKLSSNSLVKNNSSSFLSPYSAKGSYSSIELFDANRLLKKEESKKEHKKIDISLIGSPTYRPLTRKHSMIILKKTDNNTNNNSSNKNELKKSKYSDDTFSFERKKQQLKSVKLLYTHFPLFKPEKEVECLFQEK